MKAKDDEEEDEQQRRCDHEGSDVMTVVTWKAKRTRRAMPRPLPALHSTRTARGRTRWPREGDEWMPRTYEQPVARCPISTTSPATPPTLPLLPTSGPEVAEVPLAGAGVGPGAGPGAKRDRREARPTGLEKLAALASASGRCSACCCSCCWGTPLLPFMSRWLSGSSRASGSAAEQLEAAPKNASSSAS